MRRLVDVTLLVLFLSVVPILAQEVTCPTIVESALESVNTACLETGRNEVCYGNNEINATFRTDDAQFSHPGDIITVSNIQSLMLSPMGMVDEVWGIALMRIQANLPDSLPGQNVTMLLFGDVQVENRIESLEIMEMTVATGVNVRLRPSSDSTLIGSLSSGATVIANGRYADSGGEEWLRIRYDEHVNRTGWVIGWAVDGDGRDSLPQVEPTDLALGPMQAFYFRTGVGDAPCLEAPDSGILLQTPAGVGQVTLNANGVTINMGSTVYLQAQPDDYMLVNTLEGSVTISAGGVSQTVPAGTASRIPLDADGLAAGTPEFPHPYDFTALQALPVEVVLPQVIDIVPALDEADIAAAVVVVEGQQCPYVYETDFNACPWYAIATSNPPPQLPVFGGQPVSFYCNTGYWETGRFGSFNEAEAYLNSHTAEVTVDGVPLDISQYYAFTISYGWAAVGADAHWTATPGIHTVTATIGEFSNSCNIVVEE